MHAQPVSQLMYVLVLSLSCARHSMQYHAVTCNKEQARESTYRQERILLLNFKNIIPLYSKKKCQRDTTHLGTAASVVHSRTPQLCFSGSQLYTS